MTSDQPEWPQASQPDAAPAPQPAPPGGYPPPGAYYAQPGGSYPPPGGPYPAGQPYWPPRPQVQNPAPRRWKRWIILAVVLVLLIFAGVGVAVWLGVRAITAPKGVVNDYLADVRAERYDAAYGRLCPSSRDKSTVGNLIDRWQDDRDRNGPITDTTVTGVQTQSNGGSTQRTVTVELEHGSSVDVVVFEVGKVNDEFCVLSYRTDRSR